MDEVRYGSAVRSLGTIGRARVENLIKSPTGFMRYKVFHNVVSTDCPEHSGV